MASKVIRNKKRIRNVKKASILIYCEGLEDKVFIDHLKNIFGNDLFHFTIRDGKGGSPKNIIESCIKFIGDFEPRIVMIDKDKTVSEIELAQNLANENNIKVVMNEPCLEALLLSILNKDKDFSIKKSDWCKKEFEKKYIKDKERTDIRKYAGYFDKKSITEARKRTKVLDEILKILEGEFPK